MNKRSFLMWGALTLAALPMSAAAQEVTLRLHQFLPPPATIPAKVLKPWGEAVKEASGGKIEVQHFDAMALGGRPPALMDQVIDGVVDLTMTVVGYTPGRFPRTEVFELPFMMKDPTATSAAFYEMVETDFANNEYKDVKVLGAWVHGPGVIHTKKPMTKLEDMKGNTMRGPTRVINDMLGELGATPVGMPLPAIPEALSKGVISGTVIPWEVTPAIRLSELVSNHAEFDSEEALYTATIVLVMNKAKYDGLSDEMRAAIDSVSGAKLSTMAGKIVHAADVPTRAIAEKAGNTFVTLDSAEVDRWKEASKPVVERWLADMSDKGIDGQALIDQAKALIDSKAK